VNATSDSYSIEHRELAVTGICDSDNIEQWPHQAATSESITIEWLTMTSDR